MGLKSLGAKCAAGVVCAFLAGAASASTVVFNGTFEDTSSSTPGAGLVNGQAIGDLASGPGRSWDVFTSIPGWTTDSGAGIEVQTNRTLSSIDAHSGQHYIELDSHPKATSNSSMVQTIMLGIGTYKLSFWYSPRNGDAGSNGIEYSVTGAAPNNNVLLLNGLTGPSAANGTSVGNWTQFTSRFTVATGDSPVHLKFEATGKANTLGGFVDSVSISAVPVPAGLPMLLTAVAGFGYVARRRTRKA